MLKKDLIEKLQDIEWQDFEVKEAKSEIPKNSWETVSAFANTSGGWLIFGVSKKGKDYSIVGVSNSEKIEQDFTTTLRGDKFNRKILAVSKKYNFDGKDVLAFHITSVHPKNKPVYFNALANTFIRTGSGDQRATKEEIDAMYRNSSFDKKDEQLTSYAFEDLDKETINMYRTHLKSIDSTHRYNSLSAKKMLETMGVIIEDKVTVGGLLVFGKEADINRIMPDFRVEYIEVNGTSYADALNRYEYRMPVQKNLYEYYFAIMEKLLKHVDIPFKLKGMTRDENPGQIIAIREALTNLLMHTDYYSNARPRIRVLRDRIEFYNPGCLPKDIKYILKEEFSMPRNNVIAIIFRTIRLSENIGTGFQKMFRWTEYYKRKPVVEGDFDYYKIQFYLEKKEDSTPQDTAQDTPQVTALEEKIILQIQMDNKISRNELAKKLSISPDTVKEYLEKLKNKGVLERIGKTSAGYWSIKTKRA